jgi:tetratricopeptide (TPR) repeat protein/tRNA A-37 threonylcarbamoyl transferase component Bud32
MLGSTLGGRYQIVRHLGGGGFGQTYLAEDLHLPSHPQCVVKQLHPRNQQPEVLQASSRLFNAEAEVLYRLGSHDQIPRLFAHFEEGGAFYLVQEWIEGDMLATELVRAGKFKEAQVLALLEDLLKVLEFVHQQQVVHRDIKPANLMRRASDRRIVLIDFGAVKQVSLPAEAEDSETESSVSIAVGSSGYMPNEQLFGQPQFSSDIYAVGMLAIQCLTGIHPRKLQADVKTGELIWRPLVAVSSELAEIVDRMVRYDYRDRYASAVEARAALASITQVAAVEALLSNVQSVSHDGHLAWLERGDELFNAQRYREAVTAYDKVLQAQPEDYLAWFKRGLALDNLTRYEAAIASYDQVIALQPEDYLAWFKRGNALENLTRYGEALQAYDQVVAIQPENYWAWHDRGRVLEALQRYEVAVEAYDRAVQLKSDFQVAVEGRKRVLSKLQRIDVLYQLEHYDAALAACDAALTDTPNDPLAWLMRGMALDNLGQYEAAIAAYDQVVALQPDDHVVWFKRGNALEKLNCFEDAIASYYKVVQIQPENHWAWHDRGRLLEQLRRYEEALASLDRAIQHKPDFHPALDARARILSHIQQARSPERPELTGDSDRDSPGNSPGNSYGNSNEDITRIKQPAVSTGADQETFAYVPELTHILIPPQPLEDDEADATAFDPAASLGLPATSAPFVSHPVAHQGESAVMPVSPTLHDGLDSFRRWFQRGRALEKLQRYAEALTAYDQASQIQGDYPDLWRWRGNVLHTLGRYEEAIASYDRALRLKPDNAVVWCYLGSSLVTMKRLREALACFEKAIVLEPQRHNLWYWRGRVQAEMGLYADAVQSFERALEIKPGFQPAIRDRQRILTKWKPRPKPAEAGDPGLSA